MGKSDIGTALIIGVVIVGGILVFKKAGGGDILKNFGFGGLKNLFSTGSVTGNQPHLVTQADLNSNEEGTVVANPVHSASDCSGFTGAIKEQCLKSGKVAFAHSYFAGGRYDGRGIGSRISIA